MSLPVSEIAHILAAHKLPPAQLQAIVADLNQAEAEIKGEREAKATKAKNKLVPVLIDDAGVLSHISLTGFVVQVPEDTDPATILPKLYEAAYAQGRAAKRRRHKLDTLRDVVEHLKRKHGRDQGVLVKGKELVQVIIAPPGIPTGAPTPQA